MEFLTPIFAAVGVAAAAIPVVLHMLRRAPTQKMPFSLVRFLKPSRPKLTKRSSIEHWPLMLLRILALVLIGLAFARPFLREVVPLELQDESQRSVTLLIDRSASMRRDGIYEQVQQTIREVTDDLGDQDLLSVVTYSNSSTTLISQTQWATATTDERQALVEGVLDSYEPDWMATNTGLAMRMAADELAQESKDRLNIRQRQLILVTDFQRGSDLDELKSGEWPAIVDVELRRMEPKKKGNAGVTFVRDRRADRIRVRVSSAGDTVQQEFELQPFDSTGAAAGNAVRLTVAPGQRRSVLLPAADGDAGKVIVGVELKGDDHPFDNVIDLPEIENPVVKVAHIGSASLNDPESMRYYLQRALDGNDERDVKLVDLLQADGVVLPVPADVRLVVATDAVPDGLLDSLSEFFNQSGTLLMAPPSSDAVLSIRSFLPVNFQVQEADVADYAMLGQIDFDHDLFSAFRDARFADFSSIRFWRHRNLMFSEEDREQGDWVIVSKFDSGLPAVADVRVGESGRLLMLATGWQPVDSQLALSTRFAPLVNRVVSVASPAQKDQLMQTVGDVITPAELVSSNDWSIQNPGGETFTAQQLTDASSDTQQNIGQTEGQATTPRVTLTEPGRYTITGQHDDGEYSLSLIAGLSPSESNTEMLPVGQLQALGIGVETDDSTQSPGAESLANDTEPGQLSSSELERRQKFWRWLLLAGLGCLVLESIWASAIERRQAVDG